MNRLNSPIVILCLIIATVFNSVMLISTFIQNKNKQDNNIKNESSVAVDTDITETTINSNEPVENDNFRILVFNTTTPDPYLSSSILDMCLYSTNIEDAYMKEIYDVIRQYRTPVGSVSCRNDGCSISFDNNTVVYNADVSKNIIEQFKTQKKLTADMLVNIYETDNGRIVGEALDLPEFVFILDGDASIYEMDSNLFNYLYSLTQ